MLRVSRSYAWALSMALALVAGCGSNGGTCKPKEDGCACVANACNSGLVCSGGLCRPESVTGLSVSDEAARSCEVLLSDHGAYVDKVEFGEAVTGRWLRQGDKVSAAFFANQDAPIRGGAIQVAYAAQGSSFEVLRSHCYGSRGEELAGATVGR